MKTVTIKKPAPPTSGAWAPARNPHWVKGPGQRLGAGRIQIASPRAGTDEHGQKIEQIAQAAGVTPNSLDEIVTGRNSGN